MMTKQVRRSIITLFVLLASMSACQSFDNGGRRYPSTIGTFNESGDFIINPTTILDSLNHGETNVFSPVLATPSDEAILPAGSIYWTQSEYLQAANALSQVVWGESLEGWLVYYLYFNKDCDDSLGGFHSLDIIYYKTISTGLQKMYTARYIQIYPLAGMVSWGGNTDFPISEGWAAIDLTEYKVTADDALRLVEENGGKKARARVQNDCTMSVSLPTGKNDNRWDIAYYYGVNFEMVVDPYSAKYEVYVRK